MNTIDLEKTTIPVRALGRFVWIEPIPEPPTQGLIYVPEKHRKRTCEGIVRSIGPGLPLPSGGYLPTGVQPGDRVRFTPYAEGDLRPFTVAGVDYLVVDYREILCVIED